MNECVSLVSTRDDSTQWRAFMINDDGDRIGNKERPAAERNNEFIWNENEEKTQRRRLKIDHKQWMCCWPFFEPWERGIKKNGVKVHIYDHNSPSPFTVGCQSVKFINGLQMGRQNERSSELITEANRRTKLASEIAKTMSNNNVAQCKTDSNFIFQVHPFSLPHFLNSSPPPTRGLPSVGDHM